MRTSCSHCGTHFKVPDKTLGKQARCKSCGKMFVITPAGEEVELPTQEEVRPPTRRSSPPPSRAVNKQQAHDDDDDPLGALADAAVESGSHMHPVHGHSHGPPPPPRHPNRDAGYDDDDHGKPRRKAKGAGLAMGLGITAGVLGLTGMVLLIITMVIGSTNVIVSLGVASLLLMVITAMLGMLAVVNGSGASRAIRRARHPLAGKGNATTGTITGWLSLGLVVVALVIGGIWLSARGGIAFEKQLDAYGNPIDPDAPATSSQQPKAGSPSTTTDASADKTTPADPNKPTEAEMKAAVQRGNDAAVGTMVLGLFCCSGVFGLVAFAFWLWMLIDVCTTTFPPGNDSKTMWVLIVIFLGGLGALIYFFAGRPKPNRGRGRSRYAP